SQATAAGEVHARIALSVVAEHDFSRAHGFRGDSGIRLQADAEVGSGAASTGAANDLIASAQCDGGARGSSEVLRTFGDGANGGLKIQFRGVNLDLFTSVHRTKS